MLKRFKDSIRENPLTHCWEWAGGTLSKDGYGRMKIDGRHVMVHRVSYEMFVEKIPDGKLVLHKCDNPPCANPAHLFLGTNRENALDCLAKGRRLCGEHEPKAKLTDEAVRFIREHAQPKHPTLGLTALARRFRVSVSAVRAVRSGRQWRHVK